MHNIYYCFPEGKHKVLTMSYDDGKIEDKRLVALFNQHGIKGTFHINGGKFEDEVRINENEIKALYEGHEVSAHTYTHPTIARCPKDQVVAQIMEDRKKLESLVDYPVRGLSYPNGSYNETIRQMLPYLGIEYARVVQSKQNFELPSDFLTWQPTCHHNTHLMELGKEFVALSKKQYLYMMYVWGHSYEFTNDNNWELIEQFCEYVGGREDIWYATNIQIVDYIHAAEALRFTAAGDKVYNPSVQTVWLSIDGNIVAIEGGKQVDLF